MLRNGGVANVHVFIMQTLPPHSAYYWRVIWFKLNPGPGSTIRQINPIVRTCYRPQRMLQTRSRNSANLVNIRCEPFLNNVNHSLSLCLMNTQSVRNKTADFVDYVCGQAFDLVAITKTWLKTIDDATLSSRLQADRLPSYKALRWRHWSSLQGLSVGD